LDDPFFGGTDGTPTRAAKVAPDTNAEAPPAEVTPDTQAEAPPAEVETEVASENTTVQDSETQDADPEDTANGHATTEETVAEADPQGSLLDN
jgi:hypothetical protein